MIIAEIAPGKLGVRKRGLEGEVPGVKPERV